MTLARFPEFSLANQASFPASFGGVAALDFLASPTAVGGLVVPVIVDAVQRSVRRALAHVGKKIVEQLPRLAKGYAFSAVMLPAIVFRVGASLDHGGPRTVSFRHAVFPRMPVSKMIGMVSFDAATAVCFSFNCASCRYRDFNTAIASEDPASMLSLNVRETNADKATVAESSMISAGRHV